MTGYDQGLIGGTAISNKPDQAIDLVCLSGQDLAQYYQAGQFQIWHFNLGQIILAKLTQEPDKVCLFVSLQSWQKNYKLPSHQGLFKTHGTKQWACIAREILTSGVHGAAKLMLEFVVSLHSVSFVLRFCL